MPLLSALNLAHSTALSTISMPTVAQELDFVQMAKACGYKKAVSVNSWGDLDDQLYYAKTANELFLIEVKCSIGARENLGRPTTTARENKEGFMKQLAL